MSLAEKEELRLQIITNIIDYFDLSPKFNPTINLTTKPTDLKTEMVEIINVKKRSFIVVNLHEDTAPLSIHCPRALTELLKKNDVFMMTIAKFKNQWHLLDSSPPYLSVDIQETFGLDSH